MQRLWAPWRLEYVTRAAMGDDDTCVFCPEQVLEPPSPLLVHRGTHAFVILNKYPYNNGHLMVVPVRHIGRMAEATAEELHEVIGLTRLSEIALTEAYGAHGINVGMNLGRAAGAGVDDHLHVHLVPRWNGDTNFMSTVSQTRVVPEEPATSVARLRPIYERLIAGDA